MKEGGINMLFMYLIAILGGLFTFKFFFMLFYEKNYLNDDENSLKNSNKFFAGAFISSVYLLVLIFTLYKKVDIVQLNSIIPLYIFFHLIIWIFSCFSIFTLFMFLPDLLSIFSFILKPLHSFIEIIKEIKILYNCIIKIFNYINIYFNPFNCKGNFEKISHYRKIKLIFLISYFISGVIILSVYTNYLEANGLKTSLPSFTREYDLYKNVFVTSLIPFILNYILKPNDKK
jgi:hypothetical protein